MYVTDGSRLLITWRKGQGGTAMRYVLALAAAGSGRSALHTLPSYKATSAPTDSFVSKFRRTGGRVCVGTCRSPRSRAAIQQSFRTLLCPLSPPVSPGRRGRRSRMQRNRRTYLAPSGRRQGTHACDVPGAGAAAASHSAMAHGQCHPGGPERSGRAPRVFTWRIPD
jgi:hypothetical protein